MQYVGPTERSKDRFLINLRELRSNTKKCFVDAESEPQIISRNSKVFILMSKEHYIDLVNKIKYPGVTEIPDLVHTIVHFKKKKKD